MFLFILNWSPRISPFTDLVIYILVVLNHGLSRSPTLFQIKLLKLTENRSSDWTLGVPFFLLMEDPLFFYLIPVLLKVHWNSVSSPPSFLRLYARPWFKNFSSNRIFIYNFSIVVYLLLTSLLSLTVTLFSYTSCLFKVFTLGSLVHYGTFGYLFLQFFSHQLLSKGLFLSYLILTMILYRKFKSLLELLSSKSNILY